MATQELRTETQQRREKIHCVIVGGITLNGLEGFSISRLGKRGKGNWQDHERKGTANEEGRALPNS